MPNPLDVFFPLTKHYAARCREYFDNHHPKWIPRAHDTLWPGEIPLSGTLRHPTVFLSSDGVEIGAGKDALDVVMRDRDTGFLSRPASIYDARSQRVRDHMKEAVLFGFDVQVSCVIDAFGEKAVEVLERQDVHRVITMALRAGVCRSLVVETHLLDARGKVTYRQSVSVGEWGVPGPSPFFVPLRPVLWRKRRSYAVLRERRHESVVFDRAIRCSVGVALTPRWLAPLADRWPEHLCPRNVVVGLDDGRDIRRRT